MRESHTEVEHMTKKTEYNLGLPPLKMPAPLDAPDGWHKSFGGDAPDTDSTIKEALEAQRHAAQAWRALDEVRRHKAPTDTAAAHLGKVEKLTKQTLNNVTNRAKSAFDRLKMREGEISKKIAERVVFEVKDAAEIRQVIRALPPAERASAVSEAIQAEDLEVIGAVLSGLPLTVGLAPKEMAAFRKMAENKMAAHHVQHREEIRRAAKLAEDVLRSSAELAEEAQGSRLAREKFMEDSHRAAEAEAALAGIVTATDQTGFNPLAV